MLTKDDMAALFGSRTRVELIAVFVYNHSRDFRKIDLFRLTESSLKGVSRELDKLVGMGLVEEISLWNHKKPVYRFNPDHKAAYGLEMMIRNSPYVIGEITDN